MHTDRRCARLLVVWVLAASAPWVTAAEPASRPATRPKGPYNPGADAKAEIAAAVWRAGQENQRVLLVWGGNWCSWCLKLHGLFEEDRAIAKLLQDEYQVVSVDINSNRPLVEVYKVDTAKGVPYLTILDAAGKVVTGQETGVLEAGSKHDPARVLAFLKKQKAEPDDAAEIVKQAEVQAGRESKAVFLRFGAPWCKWCHKLDDYLYQPAVATVLRKHFVLVKVDMDRMKNAKEVAARFRSQASGIPWFAMLDARGEKLITSDAAQGNIGYPTADAEVAHFRSMLARAGSGMTPGEIDGLVAALQEHGRAKATR